MTRNFLIAGSLKPNDWHERKKQLFDQSSPDMWAKTFEEFFEKRLLTRYLNPIKALQKGPSKGEGFSIVTIQCALIEFLAATRVGKNYRFLERGQTPSAHEYQKSGDLFTDFLTSHEPFASWFTNQNEAQEFYKNVRCALVHEARTKGGWLIKALGSKAIDTSAKIIRRNAFQDGIIDYIISYKNILLADSKTQNAFIRKFDHLAAD